MDGTGRVVERSATADGRRHVFGAGGAGRSRGPGQGGSIDANIERWKSQMQGPDGKPAPAEIAKRAVRGIAMTTVDASGTYSGMGGPMAPAKPVPDYRMLGAIVEGPGGHVFVKFTGPAKTVAANRQKFDQLLASFDKEK
jgi:hypothetical protein